MMTNKRSPKVSRLIFDIYVFRWISVDSDAVWMATRRSEQMHSWFPFAWKLKEEMRLLPDHVRMNILRGAGWG